MKLAAADQPPGVATHVAGPLHPQPPIRPQGGARRSAVPTFCLQRINRPLWALKDVVTQAFTPANQHACFDPIIRVRVGLLSVMHADGLACMLEAHGRVNVTSSAAGLAGRQSAGESACRPVRAVVWQIRQNPDTRCPGHSILMYQMTPALESVLTD